MLSYRNTLFILHGFTLMAGAAEVAASSLEEIEVTGRGFNLVGSATSASQGQVSHDELALRPLLRTGEVLEVVPGMVATQHSGSGKANQFFLRGFNLDHGTDFSTSVDGMPVNMRTHGHGQGYTDLNFLVPEMIEQISFRKGAYYADVGDFSGTGAANIASAQHRDGHAVTLALGEYGYQRALLSGGKDNRLGQFIYAVEVQGYDGPWDDIAEDVGKTNVWLKQVWEQEDERFELGFMAYDNSWNSADQIPGRAVQSGLITELGSIDTTVGGDSSRYSLSGNYARQLDNGVFRASAYAIDYSMDLWSNFTYFTQARGDQFRQVDERMIYGGELERLFNGELAGREMVQRLGLQFRYDDIDEVGLLSTAGRQFLDYMRVDSVEEWSASLWYENEFHWTDRFRTVAGLRYDYYDFEVNALAAGDPGTLVPNSGTASEDIVTASLSAIYQLNDNYELYASIGQGFHSNDARGTTITLDPVTAEPVDRVDPLVDTLGSELGVRAFLTDRLNASVALWHLDIDSELLFVGDAGNTEDTGVGSERSGIEVTTYYRINRQWALDFEYSWTDARFVESVDGSKDIPGALSNVFSGGLNLQLDNGLNTYLRVRHFDGYPLDGGATAAASTLLNLRMAWDINECLALNLDLLNLLDSDDHDVEYYYESQLATEAAPVADHHYHVFEPRSVRATLNYRF